MIRFVERILMKVKTVGAQKAVEFLTRHAAVVVLVPIINKEGDIHQVHEYTRLNDTQREQVAEMYIEPFDGGNTALGTAYNILDDTDNQQPL